MADPSKIPPEFPAARALEDAFRVLGEAKTRDRFARGRSRWHRLGAGLVSVVVTMATAGAVAVGIDRFFGDGDPPIGPSASDTGTVGDLSPDERPALAMVEDPADPFGWGVRISYDPAGKACVVVGRVFRGMLGVMANGRFRQLGAGAGGGQCADLSRKHALIVVRNYGVGTNSTRSVLYGVVDRTVSSLALGGQSPQRRIPIADDGTFVYAADGSHAFESVRLFLSGAKGVESQPLGVAP